MRGQDKGHRRIRNWKSGPNFSGQHLLHNKAIIKNMIKAAGINKNDTVVDLGAGKGAFTCLLAEKAHRVLAVENDPDFVEILRKKAISNITIIEKDILKWNFPIIPFYVVSSIPYAITTPIFERLLNQPSHGLRGAVIIIEKGAAKRFIAKPITNPRILGWRMKFDIEIIRWVSRDNFYPQPKVDSAVVKITRKINPKISPKQHRLFLQLAEYGLKNPELPIYKALKGIYTPMQMKQLIKNIRVNQDTPIGLLDEEQWGEVFQTMINYVESFRWPKVKKR